MRKVLSLLLLVTLLLPIEAMGASWSRIIAQVSHGVVKLRVPPTAICSGVVSDLKAGYVVTKGHCDSHEVGFAALPSGQMGAEVFRDADADLAVYKFADLTGYKELRLAKQNPLVGDEVVSLGHPIVFDPVDVDKLMARHYMVSALNVTVEGFGGPYTVVDGPLIPGNSGGPLFNRNGDVVMLVDGSSMAAGLASDVPTLRRLVGQYWHQK